MLTIRIGNVYSKVEGFIPKEVLDNLSLACSYAPKGMEFSPLCQDGKWDGTRKLFNRRYHSFLTGLLSVVVEVMERSGTPYSIADERVEPTLAPISMCTESIPRDYQEEAVEKVLKYTRGMIKGGCGAGKTNIMTYIIARTGIPTLIVTHTSTVFLQTIDRLKRDLGVEIGAIGGGSWEYDKKITVGLTASLTKHTSKPALRDFLSEVQCLLIDECHHIATKSICGISDVCINAYYRIGVSASPWRDDSSDLLLNAITGRQLVDLSASYLIQRGYLTKPTIKFIHFKHRGQPWQLDYKEVYVKEVVDSLDRNSLIASLAKTHIDRGESVLISVHRIRHGEVLENLIRSLYSTSMHNKIKSVDGEDHPEVLNQTLVDMRKKELLCVIATGVYKEGIDIPSLDCLINCKAEDSSVSAFQTIGRALRKAEGKEGVIIYDIFDYGCRWLGTHSENRELIYRTEPEFVIEHVYDGTY